MEKVKTVAEYLKQQSELQKAQLRMSWVRKRVAEYIETQLEVNCAHLPEESYGEAFQLRSGNFDLAAWPLLPGAIEVRDDSGKALFYLDLLTDTVKMEISEGVVSQ